MTRSLSWLQTVRPVRAFAVVASLSAIALGGFFISQAHADPTNVVINEFSSNSSSDWVELYNPTNSTVNVSGWTLEDSTTDVIATIPNSTSILSKGFLKVDVGNRLNEGGDTITLLNASSSTIDFIFYGIPVQPDAPHVAAPGSGESAGREPDGSGNWVSNLAPTPGYSNVAPTTDIYVSTSGSDTTGNGSSAAPFATINKALSVVASGGTIHVEAGTYTEGFSVDHKTSVTIDGAGATTTTIAPATLIDTGLGHKYTKDMHVSVLVSNSTNVTLSGMTIQSTSAAPGAGGADAIVFWNGSTGSMSDDAVTGIYTPINGTQTGQGIAVDGSSGAVSLAVNNTDLSGFQKNAIDAVDGNSVAGGATDTMTVTVNGGTIAGAGSTSAIAQNGILFWNQGGGTVTGSVSGTTIKNLEYTPSPEDVAVYAYGSASFSSVSNTTFANDDLYIWNGNASAPVDATTGNTFGGVSSASATPMQLAAIENKIGDAISDQATVGGSGPVFILPHTFIATTANQGIQAALNAAASGDTVLVTPGAYTENLTIKQPVSLKGPNAGIDPNTATRGPEATLTGQVQEYASNVTIDGLSFTDPSYSGPTTFKAIQVYSAGPAISNIAIENNLFSDIANAGAHGSYGVMVQGDVSNVSVSNNELNDITSAGWAHAMEVTPTCGSTNVPQDVTIAGNKVGTVTGANGDSYAFSADWCDPANVTDASQITLHGNQFGAPLRNLDTKHLLDAMGNWWGNASGPYDATSTDGSVPATNAGTGAEVDGMVNYSNWCKNAACTTYVTPAPPTGLVAKFQYDSSNIPNGTTLNITAKPSKNNLVMNWTAPPAVVTGYRVIAEFPNGTSNTFWQGPNTNAWLATVDGFGAHGQGKYVYVVKSANSAGLSASSTPFILYYDTQSPTAHFDPTPPEYVNGNFRVSGQASDNVALQGVFFDVRDPSITSGNSWVAGCVSGTALTDYSANHATASTTCMINTSNLTEGHPYLLRIHDGDYANYGGGQQQTLIVDRTRPNGSVTAPISGSTMPGSFTITGTASDALSGVDHVVVYVSKVVPPNAKGSTFGGYAVDGKLATWDSTTGTFSYSVTGLANGTYVVKADVFDKAGNNHFASPSPTITVVNTVPTLTITAPAQDGDYATSTYAFTAEYDHGVTTNLDWAVRKGADASCYGGTTVAGNVDSHHDASTFFGSTFTAHLDTTAWSDGPYCFVVNDGRHRPVRLFTVHNAAPGVPVITSPVTGSATTTADFKQVAWTSVPGTGVMYLYQSSPSDATTSTGAFVSGYTSHSWLTTTYIATPNTPLGTYYLHVRAKDAQGNESAWSPIVKVTVEKVVAPVYTYAYATTTVQAADLATSNADALANLDKWFFWNDTTNEVDNTLGSFVKGPATAPVGTGSAQITAPAGARIALASGALAGTPLSSIAALRYTTYRSAGSSALASALQFDINTSGTGAPTSYEGRLVYEPYYTHTVKDDTWQTWNTMDNASTTNGSGITIGNWWFSNGNIANTSGCSQVTPCTWAKIISRYPNIGISGGVYLKAGQWGSDFTGNIDDLVVAVKNGTNIAQTTYDFEPTAVAAGPTSLGGGASGLLGDLNGDGRVDFLDFALMMGAFGETGTGLKADLNGDHVVNAADLAILLGNWTGS